ncbi:hypothetical protein KFL_000190495 [Klebsormidium nitens]|uniref:Endoglucanase n=1 Tax=Klebsormidium nitens TaxID=105231 RepID=A0A1Y1HMB6_KLENI|nr:hypothetical protein KFL_000190495 [Klebsormidium nitens]|eukprot:GAQ78832.1 hypothetical protein KFL_000190495 [Klebsormidium nitens]
MILVQYVCYYVNRQVPTTPDGLAYIRDGSNMQYSNNAAFLSIVYSDYLSAAGQSLTCNNNGGGTVTYSPAQIVTWARTQIDYVLGGNAAGRSYMVGFGSNYPTRVHHRGASVPSPPPNYSCGEGFQFYHTNNSDPHVITGAIVGGPFQDGSYANIRDARDGIEGYKQSEPTTYINAGYMGALARLIRGTSGVEPGCTAVTVGDPSPTTPEPTTPSPTTPAPTTPPPTTPTPVTPNPTTPNPTTSAPVTPNPTSPAPITPAPTTPSPTSPAPTASAPVTPSPTTSAPVTPTPTTFAPTTPSPTSPAPTTSAPITPSPTTSAPVTPAPTTSAPTTPPPITPSPTLSAPITLAPTAQTPITPSPTAQMPITPSPTAPPPTSPSPTSAGPCPGPTVYPAGGVCDSASATPNQCYSADGSFYVCCLGNCPSTPGTRPFCADPPPGDCFPTLPPTLGQTPPPKIDSPTPAPTAPTPFTLAPVAPIPAPVSATPGCPTVRSAGGVCDPMSQMPNQCYSADGSSFICCPGSCSSAPSAVPTCASVLPGCP